MGDQLDIEQFRMPDAQSQTLSAEASTRASKRMPTHLRGAFIRACPVDWLARAIELPGKACAVAIACWYAAGKSKATTAQITPKVLREMRIQRQTFLAGLRAIEAAGLVDVDRRRGRSPVVTIRFPQEG